MNRTVHSTIKVARKAKVDVEKKWSQIAHEAGCAESYLWKILNNTEPGTEKRPLIAAALGLTVEDLWPPEEERQSA